MRRHFFVLFLCFVCLQGFADIYAVYYDVSGGQNTAIVISNATSTTAYYTIRAYDYTGRLVWSDMGNLKSYESTMYDLSEHITPASGKWGLVRINSDQILVVSALYSSRDKLIAIKTVDNVPSRDSGIQYYWYALMFYALRDATVGFIIANPQAFSVSIRFYLYDEDGNTLVSRTVTLDPFASYFYNTEVLSEEAAGFLDVRATAPIILAGEYYIAGSVYTIDLIFDAYAVSD